MPGGAANTAANLARLGGRASLLSAVGDDLEGGLLRGAMAWCGIDRASLLVEPSRHTPTKHRVVLGAQILVRYDQGDTGPLGIATESTVFDRLSACWSESDAVVISGYGYGILTPRAITQLKRLQAKSPRVLVVDSKDLTPYRTCGPTVVKPKHTEAICLLGLPGAILEGSRAERMA